MTCLSIMLKKSLNRVSARTQPCFMLLMMGKDPERSLFNLTWLCWSLCSWITMLRNFGKQPRHSMIINSPFLLCQMLWSGFTNTAYSPLFYSQHFSWSCLRMNTISVVLLLVLNSHWVSGRWSSAMVGTNLFRSTWARIFSAMENRLIPQ